jgi:hypothetical protein
MPDESTSDIDPAVREMAERYESLVYRPIRLCKRPSEGLLAPSRRHQLHVPPTPSLTVPNL